MTKRCHFCKGRIWPWDKSRKRRALGELLSPSPFPALVWHQRCWDAFDRMLQEEADMWERNTGI